MPKYTEVEVEGTLSKVDGFLEGKITSLQSILGNVSNSLMISGSVSPGNVATNKFPFYQGSYIVTPVASLDLLLETENKVLQDNIIVNRIPYSQVSNLSGGYTVSIG